MNVLSLFDGMSCGLVALKRAGIEVDNYFASEIDEYAMAVAKNNHPEIKHLGSIEDYDSWELPKIDLIIAGPPCQGFSIAGNGLDWKDERSKLFFTAIEILWKYKPKNFLFENVYSMKKEIRKEIDELMEVDSVMINSALMSAQNRKRLYWCNWNVDQPEDQGILLKDVIDGAGIIHENFSKSKTKHYKKSCALRANASANYQTVFAEKSQTIPATIYKENAKSMVKRNKKGLLVGARIVGRSIENPKSRRAGAQTIQISEPNEDPNKTGCISTVQKDNVLTEDFIKYRKLSTVECERLQTLVDNYTQTGVFKLGETRGGHLIHQISNTQRYKMIGNGWTIDVIKHIFQAMPK